ncbi:MAG: TlpA disulfide reductase family protein [Bryobacteraceae bacterium]
MKRRLCSLVLALAVFAVAAAAATVPRRSPEFAVLTNSGKQILLSEYKGKVVALLFILTYCPHCQVTVQALSKLQNEYGPRGFQVIATAIEDMANMYVPDFIKRYQPGFPVGFNNRDQVLNYLQHPAMFKLLMPQLVFIDREGVIRAQYAGDDPFFGADQEKNLRQKIEELLREGKATASRKSTGSRRSGKK